MKAVDRRKPLLGNEVEANAVRVEIERLVQSVESSHGYLLDTWTRPSTPGVFSDAMHDLLCAVADEAGRAAGLMRRLRMLCGDVQPARVERLERHALGVPASFAVSLFPALMVATENEAEQMVAAAIAKHRQIRSEYEARARDADFCPECGGETTACDLDGSWSRKPKTKAPARICNDCKAITPNPLRTKIPPVLIVVRD